MFEFEDSRLTFEPAALSAIAHEAVEHGTGARGLRSICELEDGPLHGGVVGGLLLVLGHRPLPSLSLIARCKTRRAAALNDTIQDACIRRARMRGFKTRWIIGTDHAGISTQTKVARRRYRSRAP